MNGHLGGLAGSQGNSERTRRRDSEAAAPLPHTSSLVSTSYSPMNPLDLPAARGTLTPRTTAGNDRVFDTGAEARVPFCCLQHVQRQAPFCRLSVPRPRAGVSGRRPLAGSSCWVGLGGPAAAAPVALNSCRGVPYVVDIQHAGDGTAALSRRSVRSNHDLRWHTVLSTPFSTCRASCSSAVSGFVGPRFHPATRQRLLLHQLHEHVGKT